MKRVRSRAALVASLALVAIAATSWLALRADARPLTSAPNTASSEAAIQQAMSQMNDALKVLGQGVTAENRDTALEELSKFESAVIAAKSQVPASAADVDDKKRAAFVADFRKTLLEALKIACDAEIAVAEGKYKDADKLIKNKLGAMKSAGHSKFKPE